MRSIALALITALTLASTAAVAHSHHSSSYYTNVSGHRVHRPEYSKHAPRGASARCGDGTYSFSEHYQGTCSHHGGVSSWR